MGVCGVGVEVEVVVWAHVQAAEGRSAKVSSLSREKLYQKRGPREE